jgi:nitrogen regulatory protein PII
MSFVVVCVVDDPEKCRLVLDAWDQAGAPGATVLESSGMERIRQAGLRDDLPLLPSLNDLMEQEEEHHRTLFSVIESQELVDRLVEGVRSVIGDLDEDHTGFLFVLPVIQVWGYGKHRLR